MKTQTIKLVYLPTPDPKGPAAGYVERWRVAQVTDSIVYNPGQFLGKDEVRDLCANRQWKVTIISTAGLK